MHEKTKNLKELPYPYNLIEYIKDNVVTTGEPFDFTATSIRICMAKILSEKQMRVIELRFRDGLTLKEIGEIFDGVSRERIRQIEEQALAKLLNADRLKEYSAVPYRCYSAERIARIEAEKRLDWVLTHNTLLTTEKETPAVVSHSLDVFAGSDVIDLPIEEMELSVRSFNTLKRNDINTLYDIVSRIKTKEDLMNFRNLGVKSYNEIIQKVHSYNLTFDWEVDVA